MTMRAPKKPSSISSGIQSLDRAILILGTFTPERTKLSMSDIARATDLTTSTTFRILSSLKVHNLVRQTEDKRYTLGTQVLRLAQIAKAQLDIGPLAMTIMTWLRDESGETVGLHLLRPGLHRVVVAQVESRAPLRRTYTDLGEPIPLHHGAPGKVLLAHLAEDAQEALLRQPLAAANVNTIVDPEVMAREVEAIRRNGYSFSFAERVLGINTVAVPVHDHSGDVRASLSITGPATRMTRERLEQLVPLAKQGGVRLSAELGYSGPTAKAHARAKMRPVPPNPRSGLEEDTE